jgi:hypothetical protein
MDTGRVTGTSYKGKNKPDEKKACGYPFFAPGTIRNFYSAIRRYSRNQAGIPVQDERE